jgi:hypothetical protein
MTERQWTWGLSNGVLVLALSGFVWASLGLGVGFRPAAATWDLDALFPPLAILNMTMFAVLLWSGVRLRRKARGFRLADVPRNDPETRRISQKLKWVMAAEAVLIALAGYLTSAFQRGDLAWSWIALVLGIHFVPLAWLFGVRVYYVTGVASSAVALIAPAVLDEPLRMLVLGYGMAVVAWGSCAYLAWNADRIGPLRAHTGDALQAAQQAVALVGRRESRSGRG